MNLSASINQIGASMVNFGAHVLFDMDIEQQALLPKGPKILAANHPTTTDPFIMTCIAPEPVYIMISDVLFNVPIFGGYLRNAGHIPVDKSRGREALALGVKYLQEGKTIGIYPEGQVSPLDGSFHRVKTGTARMALMADVPIIPMGIHLDRDKIRLIDTDVEGKSETGTWYFRGPYAITIGKPIHWHGDVEDRDFVQKYSNQILNNIKLLAYQSGIRLLAARRIQPTSIMPLIHS